jgi:SAM-dependent methyltransferase
VLALDGDSGACQDCGSRYAIRGNTIDLSTGDETAAAMTAVDAAPLRLTVLASATPDRLRKARSVVHRLWPNAAVTFCGETPSGATPPEGWQSLDEPRPPADQVVVLTGKSEGTWRRRWRWVVSNAAHGRRVSVLSLDTAGVRALTPAFAARYAIEVVLNPFRNPASPLTRLVERKTDEYYERCLDDATLARACAAEYLPPSLAPWRGTALDFGCFRGRFAALLGQLGFDVTGYDVEYDPFWQRVSRARFVVGPPRGRLPFRDATFRLCMHMGVLSYIKDDAANLAEIARITQPGGVLILHVAHAGHPRYRLSRYLPMRIADSAHFRFYSVPEIEDMLAKAGFSVEWVRTEGFAAPVFGWAVHVIRKFCLARRHDPVDRHGLAARLTPPAYRPSLLVFARRAQA